MAYATANLKCWITGQGTNMPSLWIYTSTDVHTAVDDTDYFTDGFDRGMKVDDVVIVSKSSATKGTTIHYVQTVTASGAATVASAILA